MSSTRNKKYQIFISSTFEDLVEVRKEIIFSILKMHHIPACMEFFPSWDYSLDIARGVIEECDFFVLVVGGRYGTPYEDDKSFTDLEFEHALKLNIPFVAVIPQDLGVILNNQSEQTDEGKERLNQFIKKIKDGKRNINFWNDRKLIPTVIVTGLNLLIDFHREQPGWYKQSIRPDALTPVHKKIINALNEIERRTYELTSRQRYYQLLILDWLVGSNFLHLLSFGEDRLEIGIRDANESTRKILGSIIKGLGSEDQYHTFSTLSIWSNTRDLQEFIENNMKAVGNDAAIKRIILIDKRIYDLPSFYTKELRLLHDILIKFRNYSSLNEKFRKIETSFYLVEKISDFDLTPSFVFNVNDVEIENNQVVNVRSDARYMYILPERKDGKITSLKFKFHNSINEEEIILQHNKFFSILNSENLLSIEQMIDINKKINEKVHFIDPHFIAPSRYDLKLQSDEYTILVVKAQTIDAKPYPFNPTIRIVSEDESGYVHTVIDISRNISAYISAEIEVLKYSNKWMLLSIDVDNAIEIPGLIARISEICARKEISICLYSLYDAEYILVRFNVLANAIRAFEEEGIPLTFADDDTRH